MASPPLRETKAAVLASCPWRPRHATLSIFASAGSILILVFSVDAARAADATGASEVVFLGALLVLMVVGRLLGELMVRLGQPSVMGQLLAGVLLGPSVLGLLWPDLQHALFPAAKEQKAMLDAVSQFGILLLLLLTGMETDLKLVRKVGRAAVSVSLTGVAIPFGCGVALGLLMPESLLPAADKRLLTALFLGTALSISSIKIVAAIVREMGFARRHLGQVIVSSAIMEDTIGWVIIAITFGLAQAGRIDGASVAMAVLGTVAFMGVSLTIGRRVVFVLIRWANDVFESEFAVITMILAIMVAMALITQAIGVHTVLGAFVAGILVGESPILTRHIDEQLRGLIMGFFMPVFFGTAGLNADLAILAQPQLLLLTCGLIAIASIGKFAGAFVGGELGGLTRREAFALACGMNARGSTEVIVASIGLSLGALTQDLFTMIVAMALVTTLAMPPMLRSALSRVPASREERERLEREEFEEKAFVANLERLLLAVDDGPSGRFAARLAGLLAAAHRLSVTVLPLAPAGANGDRAEENVRAAAECAVRDGDKIDAAPPPDVLVRQPEAPGEQGVAAEAEKGYDLLLLGLEKIRARGGSFHRDVARIAATFDGPLVIVVARAAHLREPEHGPLRVLVPVDGTAASRRAAEVAISFARGNDHAIAALHVEAGAGRKGAGMGADMGGDKGGNPRARREAQAIVEDISAMAEHYDVKAEVTVRAGGTPATAILEDAKRSEDTLIVIGVNRRPGSELSFGHTAAALLEHSPASVVFVAT